MRTGLAMLSLCWAMAGAAFAEDAGGPDPVVVELYTSQGCASCPPADALLTELAGRSDVIALALHVDYWDYIGWPDPFGAPSNTARQKAYARMAGSRTVYTPQMVVGGVDHVVGTKPLQLAGLIDKHHTRPDPVDLEVARDGGTVRIAARPPADGVEEGKVLVVSLVTYLPEVVADISRGENAGRRLLYTNVVRDWRILAEWDGEAPLALLEEAEGPLAVIVQESGPGAILAAAHLR